MEQSEETMKCPNCGFDFGEPEEAMKGYVIQCKKCGWKEDRSERSAIDYLRRVKR